MLTVGSMHVFSSWNEGNAKLTLEKNQVKENLLLLLQLDCFASI